MDNLKLWNSFNDYIDHLVEQDHKKLEQAENTQDMYRAQGSIAIAGEDFDPFLIIGFVMAGATIYSGYIRLED